MMHEMALQVAEVMAKVAEQVRDAEEEAERRAPNLDALQDIASMRAECAWLASYEKDSARFKVCFCSPCSRHAAHCLLTEGVPRAPECLSEALSMLVLSILM